MTYANTWINNDGMPVPFGKTDGVDLEAGSIHAKGEIKELKKAIDVNDLPSSGTAPLQSELAIPSGATILSVRYIGTTAFDNAMEIGTMDSAGTTVDKNGLATTLAFPVGVTNGSGAQIGTTASQDLYLTVEATSTASTTGAGTIVVEYSL